MYQGIQNQQPTYGGYYQTNPYAGQYPRYTPTEAQAAYPTFSATTCLKGRPVVSLEEARAAQIDLDGSLHIFTDIGNKKIYTKQINVDGTATLNTYSLVEEPVIEQAIPQEDYVTKAEFNQALSQIQTILNGVMTEKEKKSATLNDF